MDKAQPSELVERVAKGLAMFMFDTWGDAEGVVWAGLRDGEKDKARAAAKAAIERLTPTPEPCRLREALVEARAMLGRMDMMLADANVGPPSGFVDTADKIDSALSASPAEPEEATENRELRQIIASLGYCTPDASLDFMRMIPAEIAAMRSAEPEEATEAWRPIESAPKDGTMILVAGGTRTHPDDITGDRSFSGVAIAFWNTSWKQWDGEHVRHDDCYSHESTHWMPLPEPPVSPHSGIVGEE